MSEIPLPKATEKKSIGLEVDSSLLKEVKAEIKSQGVTVRSVIEWGMRQWLLESKGLKRKKV